MRSYLINRLQRCKINNFFSERAKISAGVYKNLYWVHYFSISVSITYIFLFLQKYDQPNDADDSIMYASDKRVYIIIDLPRHEFTILSKWFYNDFMFLMVLTIHCKPTWYVVMKLFNKNTKQEKVLVVTLNNKLNFATHLLNITKSNKKFNTLNRVQKIHDY